MAYNIRIRVEISDDDSEEVATLERIYSVQTMAAIRQVFKHATDTVDLLVEGVDMNTWSEVAAEPKIA